MLRRIPPPFKLMDFNKQFYFNTMYHYFTNIITLFKT